MLTVTACPSPACQAELSDRDRRDGWCPRCGTALTGSLPTPQGKATPLSSVTPAVDPDFLRRERARTRPPIATSPQGVTSRGSFGKYEVFRKLSDSSTSKVYEAIDTVLKRPVALKILKLNDPANLKRFKREAQTAARIDHPNFCQIYEIGEVNGVHYLALEYLHGKTLEELIEKDPRALSAREAAAVVRRLALAMTKAHEFNVVHRDLKPGNIMIDPQGAPVIIDFGMAKLFDVDLTVLTKFGTPFGTPCYMPPEQVHGDLQSIGPSVDIYSLGVVLYELVAGRRPYVGESLFEIFAQITGDAPPPKLSEARPGIDPDLETICARAMAKSIADRYPAMAEFAEALDDWLRATELSPNGLPATERPPRALTVSAEGDGDYRRISEAIRHAAPGTRIYVRPGTYHERILIDFPVEVLADGPPGQVIVEGVGAACLSAESDGIRVRGIGFRRVDQVGLDRLGLAAVEVRRGRPDFVECEILSSSSLAGLALIGRDVDPTFSKCVFRGGEEAAVLVTGPAQGVFNECEVTAPGRAGVIVNGQADPTFKHCRIDDSKPGAYVHEDGRGTWEDCQFRRNAKAGVMVGDQGAPTLLRCRVAEGPDAGLFLFLSAKGRIEDCQIEDQGDSGLIALDQAQPTVKRCQVRGNKQAGALVVGQARPHLEACELAANHGPNLRVRGGAPTVRHCRIHHGLDVGAALSHARGTYEDCEVHANARSGILIHRGGAPTLRRCEVHHSGGPGVRLEDPVSPLIESCRIHDNGGAGVDIGGGADPTLRGCRLGENGQEAVVVRDRGRGTVEFCDLSAHRRSLWSKLMRRPGSGPWRLEPGTALVRRDNTL